ncbi:MAG: thioredoxin family protein [Pseudoflavonifractor sp.]|nr:thioredoxin family protein [Pseudoflavonifractor sp.]
MDYTQLINSRPVVLVEFYATWCPHCRRMMPVVDDVRALVEGQALIAQLDIDQNNEVADEAGVKSVPTFIVYRDGRETWRSSGEIDGNVLYQKIEQAAR